MKKSIVSFSIFAVSSLLLMMGCNSKDYNSEPAVTTTESAMPDTTQHMMSDTSHMMSMDTSHNGSATNTNPAVKAKKGKVSTMMMTNSSKNLPMNQDKQGYYSSVEVLPMFPGGQPALDNFINNTIEYPANANDNGIEGKVTVNFAVDEMGKVSNPKIVGKPLGYGLEEEVLKAVNKMPTWTPGIIKGKNVKTYYTLPVNFKIEQ